MGHYIGIELVIYLLFIFREHGPVRVFILGKVEILSGVYHFKGDLASLVMEPGCFRGLTGVIPYAGSTVGTTAYDK